MQQQLTVKRSTNPASLLMNALLFGAIYGILPYFLFIQTGLIDDGVLKDLVIFTSIVMFLVSFILNFIDFRVNEITLTDKELIYRHASWGKVVTSSVDLANIKNVYVAPSRVGTRLFVSSNNALESFVTIGYSLRQISPIKEALKKYTDESNQNLDITDETSVNPKRLMKMILITVTIILLFSIGLIWYVVATGSNNL